MNYWKVILATMVIFGAGVMTGGLLVQHVGPGWGRRPVRVGAGPRAGQLSNAGLMRLELLRRMEQDLDLTPEQREPASKVIKEGQERMKKLMQTVEPRRREVYRKTIEDFRALLTPGQKRRFDALLKKQQRARSQRKGAPPRERFPKSPPPAGSPSATNSPPGQPAAL